MNPVPETLAAPAVTEQRGVRRIARVDVEAAAGHRRGVAP